jgi:hypothetical protein
MTVARTVFELTKRTDNPVFEGFAATNSPSLLGRNGLDDDLTPGYGPNDKSKYWRVTSLSETWKTLKVVGRVAPFNDFPCLNMIYPAFSERACEKLGDMLEPNGELLPLDSISGRYFLYNITRIVDALDMENSVCDFWCEPPTTAVDIDHFAFREKEIASLSIFRIYDLPMCVFVTDVFARRVHEAGLNGFHFDMVWPLSKEVGWRNYNKNVQKQANPEGEKYYKQNTLVVTLKLKGAKSDGHENARIRELENELDALLATTHVDEPYSGRYEGSDVVDGEYRMFISCPNVETLLVKLGSWLKNLNWRDMT